MRPFAVSTAAACWPRSMLLTVADYPLGRIGSCLRPGMVRGPGPFKEKREKCFIKTCFSFFYHFQASMYRFLCSMFMVAGGRITVCPLANKVAHIDRGQRQVWACGGLWSHSNMALYKFCIVLYCIVFVKQHKLVNLVQYIVLVESIFCFYCITVRPAIYLCLRPEIS